MLSRGIRFLPWAEVQRGYLDCGRTRIAGRWYNEAAIEGLTVPDLLKVLGLEYTHPDGSVVFGPSTQELGVLRFPVTPTVLRCSTVPISTSAGGAQPDPPVSVRWSGNGFAPGALLVPERQLATIAMPNGTEIGRMSADGTVSVVAQWEQSEWEAS